ncbi:hypothetical protein [Alteromonas mediterranea]|uniref:hypothetical protein n=1 Tax=Alteromonas mediterranea TaxID=314275 RepID=UPI00076FE710|nr:hypothetical protein [Alteromonas mediterranea]AMJ83076.1 hypothetical protein AV941_11855 [Alteromonas mediterranea]
MIMLLNSERHHDKASFLLVCGLKLALTFIIDTRSWEIVLLVVDTNNWLPGGKHLALLPTDVDKIDWAAHCVSVKLSHDELINRPEVDSDKITEESYIPTLCAQINSETR